MKKIIITGGLGYIGSLLAEKLIQDNYEVFIFDNFFNLLSGTGTLPVFGSIVAKG